MLQDTAKRGQVSAITDVVCMWRPAWARPVAWEKASCLASAVILLAQGDLSGATHGL